MATTRVVTPEPKSPSSRVRLNPLTPPYLPPSLVVESSPQKNSDLRKPSYAAVVKSRAAPGYESPLRLPATEWPPLRTPASRPPPPPPKIFERKGAREPPDIPVNHRRKRRRRRKRNKNAISPTPSTELDPNDDNIADLASIIDTIHQETLTSYRELLNEMIKEMRMKIVKELKTALRKAIDFQNSKMSRSLKNIRIDFEKFQFSVSQQLRALKAPRATQNAAGKRKKSKKRHVIEKEGDIGCNSDCESVKTIDIVLALNQIFGEESSQSECSNSDEDQENDMDCDSEDEENEFLNESDNVEYGGEEKEEEQNEQSDTEMEVYEAFSMAEENNHFVENEDGNEYFVEEDDGNESFLDGDGFYHATNDY